MASGATSGTEPILSRSSGSTAVWAAIVAPRAVQTKPGRLAANIPDPATTPAVASTDS